MLRMVGATSHRWSLARQLVMLQLSVVITAVTIEAMVAIYRGPRTAASWEQRQILGLVTLTEVALLVGIAGSLFLADRVRRQTFDMEPAEIARRYQHHDAMLHAVREGLIITDTEGGIVLANDEARRLLGLAADCADTALREQLVSAGWAAEQASVTDQMRYAAGRVLMVSRSPAEVEGTPAGMVTTLRDRTELQMALHELSEAQVLSAELRKQAHEHANHLQMVIALIEMKEYDEAVQVCAKYAETPQLLSAQLLERIADPVLASRLEGVHTRAKRCGVEFGLHGTLGMARREIAHDLADIVGNLADNAIDAVEDHDASCGQVTLSLISDADGALRITVRDNGPGITANPVRQIFAERWTTKNGADHGFGLAVVRDKVAGLGGDISVHNDGGAVFEVRIPALGKQARSDT